MNFKQKLVYMLIGSLFTPAGYFLASIANNQPPNAETAPLPIRSQFILSSLSNDTKEVR